MLFVVYFLLFIVLKWKNMQYVNVRLFVLDKNVTFLIILTLSITRKVSTSVCYWTGT